MTHSDAAQNADDGPARAQALTPSASPLDPSPNPDPPPRWRQTEARARSDRRWLRLGAGVATLLAGVGLLALIGWYRPLARPALVVLTGPTTGREAPPYGRNDLRALEENPLFASGSVMDGPIAPGFAPIRRSEHAGPLVVSVVACAWVGPVDPSVASETRSAPPIHLGSPGGPTLADLVAATSGRPGLARLILLDLMPPDDLPDGGPGGDALAVAVRLQAAALTAEAQLGGDEVQPLAILVATEPGQRPLRSDMLGRSVFGYYVDRGLRGLADRSGDGRLTARELASFVRDRVARHARQVFGRPQTPFLVEAEGAADFAIGPTPHRPPSPVGLPEQAPKPPEWWTRAWRDRDGLLAASAGHEALRPLAQLEATLLQAEQGWLDGRDPDRARAAWLADFDQLRERIDAARAIPRPAPRSLAQAVAWGQAGGAIDPETRKAVAQAVADRPKAAADAKPEDAEAAEAAAVARFFASATPRFRSDLDLARAAVAVAVDDPAPTPGMIHFLDRLLAARQPRPLYAETLALRRLAARPATDWQADQVRQWLLLVCDAEEVQAEPLGTVGAASEVDNAAQLVHEASVVFEALGYATASEVGRRLAAARVATDAARAHVATLVAARQLADEALRLLPAETALIESMPDLARPWSDAAESASLVLDGLEGSLGEPADGQAGRVEILRVALGALGPRAIAARVAELTRDGAPSDPARLRAIHSWLAIALPTAEQRLVLRNAAIAVERQLTSAVLNLDERDGSTVAPAALAEAIPGREQLEAPPMASAEPIGRRLRERLLRLGGLSPESSRRLSDGSSSRAIGSDLAAACEGRPLAARDRLARLVPPWIAAPDLDDPARDPTRLRRLGEFQTLRRQLGGRYAFEARDAGGSGFATEAARDFEAPGDPPATFPILDVAGAIAPITPEHPEVALSVGVRANRGAGSGVAQVEASVAGVGWLDLASGRPPDGAAGSTGDGAGGRLVTSVDLAGERPEVPILVRLRDEAEPPAEPLPAGLLIRARSSARTAHRLVPLQVEPPSYRLRVTLTADPAGSGPDLVEIRPRAAQGKVSAFLNVRNPGTRERRVVAELFDRRGPIAGTRVPLVVAAGGSTRLVCGPPAAKPEEGWAEIRGPLTILLTDPTGVSGPIARSVPVGLADPTDYLRVVDARFEPARARLSERSHLEIRVRAVGPIAGPPCPIELVVTPDRIPGLVSPGEGTYAGELAKVGDEVTLVVDGIVTSDRTGEPGHLDLTMDGVARAVVLQLPVGSRGAATRPVLVTRPAVRLRVGRSALPAAPLPVGIELDAPPPAGRVVLEVGRSSPGGFQVESRREVEAARGLVRLNPRGPDGALLVEATVRDPSTTIEIARNRGLRQIRARLLDENGQVRASADAPLVIDDRSPTGVELINPPRYALKGGTVPLRATATAPQSGVKEVVFFVGRPADGKRPAGVEVVPGRPVDGAESTWVATLPLGDAKLGPTPVSVEVRAGVGLGQFATATVLVVDAIPVEPGTIRGSVTQGGRPQPGLDVVVTDEKGAEKGRTKTDDVGRFEVAGLPPGAYQVLSEKPTPPTRGSTPAPLKAGETREITVELFHP